jgi:hypothetical protein
LKPIAGYEFGLADEEFENTRIPSTICRALDQRGEATVRGSILMAFRRHDPVSHRKP